MLGISNTFNGISKLFIQSILDELNIENTPTKDNLNKIYTYIKDCLDANISVKNYKSDYSITLQGDNDTSIPYLNFFIDDFYTKKETTNEFITYRNTLLKLVDGTLKKITKKLNNINTKLKDCKNKDIYKLYGELITANIYKFKEFTEDYIEVQNYYNNEIIKIPVNKYLTPSVNAKNYYKKYNKLKSALEIVNKQKAQTIEELNYIETVIYSLDNTKTVNDVDEIYSELKENELFFKQKIKPAKSNKTKRTNKKVDKEYSPIEYKIGDYTFLVGKNNKQNDYLSTKVLKNHDIWFHTKDITSSHGILQTNNTTPSIDVIIRCAQIIAYYSKARQSSNVPVEYTLGQYVKKPSGSKPGMVIYTHNSTINVPPIC